MQGMSGNLWNPKPGHITGRSSRGGARRGSEGGRGWIGRDAIASIRPGDNPPSCLPANCRNCPGRLVGKQGQTKSYVLVDSKTRTYNGRVGSGRGAAGLGRAEQFAQGANVPRTLQGIDGTSLECLPRSTNKRNRMTVESKTRT